MNETLTPLLVWLSKSYQSQLGLTLHKDKIQTDESQPVALWRMTDAGGLDCAELLDKHLGVWLRFRAVDEQIKSEALSKLIDTDIQWGLRQLTSSAPTVRAGDHDEFGGWQIHLIWLVSKSHQAAWCEKMQAIRAGSGFSEELGLDGIFFDDAATLTSTLESHRLPQLLFSCRKLLYLSAENMPQWLRANEIFAKALNELPEKVDAIDKLRTEELVAEVLGQFQSEIATIESPVTTLSRAAQYQKLTVENIRSVSKATLGLPTGKVVVVHGPNGSGKSSLFEALALGVTGSSTTLRNYLDKEEKDLLPTEKRSYVGNVLANRRQPVDSRPVIQLDDKPCAFESIASTFEEASDRVKAADGNFLAQEDARAFVSEAGANLAVRILRGYSDLADKTQDFVDAQYNHSNQRYRAWLGEYGLNAGITLAQTRFAKLARKLVGDHVPIGGQGIGDWLSFLTIRFPEADEQASAAGLRWQRIDSPAGREELSEKMADADKLGFGADVLQNWFTARLGSLQEIDLLDRRFETRIQNLTSQLDEIRDDLKSWATWKTRQTQTQLPQIVAVASAELAVNRIALLERELAELTRKGQDLNLQNEHLTSVRVDVLPKWQKNHLTECPTCNSTHPGGIEQVVVRLQAAIQEQVEALRSTYREKQNEIKQLRMQQTTLDKCPVSEERQEQLADLLNVASEGPEGLDALISQPRGDELILQSITALAARPKLRDLMLGCEPAKEAAGRVFESITQAAAAGESLRIAPDSWGRIKKTIDSLAAELVRQHLPNTLESVWQEIAFNLTPARWNLWGHPRLIPTLTRGAQKLTVVIEPNKNLQGASGKNLLARYAFNQAEQHILGLAWFFTRYLSQGRFQHALIALDDPAQEMDQTTYRTFVRWIQAMSRLHVAREIPLSMVIFLHQEDRALDLARATSLSVVMIEWAAEMRTHGSKPTVKTLQLNNSEYKWPLPEPFKIVPVKQGAQAV